MWSSYQGGMQWYNDPRFERYWNYYNQSKAWFDYHLKSRNAKRQFYAASGCSPTSVPHDYGISQCQSHTSSRNFAPSPENATYSLHLSEDRTNDEYANSSEDSNEEFEMIVTEEMIDFFEQSERYRRERDESKLLSSQSAAQELVDLADIKPEHRFQYSSLPPSGQEKSQRAKEMKYLYGKDAAMIHGMETAMQLTFHRYCDTYQPKLWPNMPLKI